MQLAEIERVRKANRYKTRKSFRNETKADDTVEVCRIQAVRWEKGDTDMDKLPQILDIPSVSDDTNFWMVRTKRGFSLTSL